MNKYFKRSEFQCKCLQCGFAAVDAELLEVLTDIRETYNSPVKITSACRCESHNRKVGGKEDSMHTKGMAADIVVQGLSPAKVAQYLLSKYPGKYGIGVSETFVHIDVRDKPARWTY